MHTIIYYHTVYICMLFVMKIKSYSLICTQLRNINIIELYIIVINKAIIYIIIIDNNIMQYMQKA